MMPPFGADDTGLCGRWADAAWMTDAEIELFGAWVEGGAPRGDERAAPPAREEAPRAPARPAGTLTVDTGEAFAPGLGDRAVRCFLVSERRALSTSIIGVAVAAEPAGAVRQAALYELTGAAANRRARALDAADAGPGWACYGAPDITGARLLADWSRNTPDQRLPDGTGMALDRASTLVVQLRYDLIASAPGIPVRARFVLATGSASRAARLVPLRSEPFSLPPGVTQARVRAAWTVPHPTTFLGVAPRMHTLGRVLDLVRARGGQRQCLAHFGHWDVYDQQLFRAAAPIDLAAGDELTLTCELDTTSRTDEVKMGEAPDDEQCLAHLYLVDPN
jgi:hypothetical protein